MNSILKGGEDMKDSFENAATALLSYMTDLERVEEDDLPYISRIQGYQ